jgi:putative membrane protein insertion efficiency factor
MRAPDRGRPASPAVRLVVWVLRLYQQTFSRLFPPSCRFYPSCSQYTLEATERFGVLRGLGKGALRVLRCHPLHPGGYDPVRRSESPRRS